jgi:UDPglucose 6-dehydrogenase
MTKITLYGTGYVGLVTGVCLAENGHTVCCADIDENKIQSLEKGIPTIEEKDLPELLKKNLDAGRIKFTSNLQEAFNHGKYHFIAVGTPEGKGGEADLTFVHAVATMINAARTEPFILVNKSTVPVGTAENMRLMLCEEQKKNNKAVDFSIVSNPEFLREGVAIHDCLHPDRIILGGATNAVEQVLIDIYFYFKEQNIPVLTTDSASAELTKYASNAMLATKISLMNELSLLADKTGANIEVVRKGMSLDPRIGSYFIAPGCGYGGSCFPKDVKALQVMSKKYQLNSSLLQAVSDVNDEQIKQFCEKIMIYLAKNEQKLSEKTIALWGLAFKPDTDDVRESPAVYIAKILSGAGIKIRAYDPAAMRHVDNFPWIDCAASEYHAVKNADALVIATDWEIFKTADLKEVYENLNAPVIFDGRNLYDLETMKEMGFNYFSVGRPDVISKEEPSESV